MSELTNSEEALQKRREEFREFRAQRKNAARAAKLLRIRSNDPFVRSYPGEPLVQRIGVFVLGTFFSLSGAVMLDLMIKDHSHLGVVVSILALIIGIRTIIVAFTGPKAKPARRMSR
jgi:hypothetical protein